jgi:hypothetical protein
VPVNIPPPPVWSPPNSAAWLDWFVRVSTLTKSSWDAIETGFTSIQWARSSSTFSVNTTPQACLSLTVTTDSSIGAVVLNWDVAAEDSAGYVFTIKRGSTTLVAYPITSGPGPVCIGSYVDSPGVGTFTYYIYVNDYLGDGLAVGTLKERSMTAMKFAI